MAGDASYNSVVLLLDMDGADSSTTFSDKSQYARTPTVVGHAQLDTAYAKYGPSSARFDGTDDRIHYPTSAGFTMGTGDFTVECWIYKDTTGAVDDGIFQISTVSGGLQNTAAGLAMSVSGTSLFGYFNGAGYSGGTVPDRSWVHVALCRVSGTTRLFLGGSVVASNADTTNYTGTYLCVGGYYSTSYLWLGNIDDFRVTKGVGRYSANFTSPARAHPLGLGEVEGVIRDDTNAPCARTVRLHRRDTGALLSSATSDASTGFYRLATPTLDEVQRIVLDDSGGTLYNDLIDRVIPA